MPDLPNSMSETTEDCSSGDNIFAIFSNLDADLRPLEPPSPDTLLRPPSRVVSTDPEVIVTSSPHSPVTYISSPVSTDGQHSPDSTSTIEASENDITIDILLPAEKELLANNSNEEQHELPSAYPLPTDCSPLLSCPNQFKHRAKTANSVHSHQHHNDSLASKPTAIIRPRINSRLRYGLKPEFNSWEIILWDNQRKELTIQNTDLSTQCITVPQEAVTALSQLGL